MNNKKKTLKDYPEINISVGHIKDFTDALNTNHLVVCDITVDCVHIDTGNKIRISLEDMFKFFNKKKKEKIVQERSD